MATLLSQAYGKDHVKLVKVSHRTPEFDDIQELEVRVLLGGPAFTPSYTVADNSLVVPTDTVKNTIYFLAHQHPLNSLESFGTYIIAHFLTTYAHVETVSVNIQQVKWTRMATTTTKSLEKGFPGSLIPSQSTTISQKDLIPHPISFEKGSGERRVVDFVGTRETANGSSYTLTKASSGLTGITVLKTTGSSFTKFHKCPLTTLPEMSDRILSTTVDCSWTYTLSKPLSAFKAFPMDGEKIHSLIRQLILDIFANHDSPSVQNTLFIICEEALKLLPELDTLSISLPNSHVFVYDLERFGVKNNAKGHGGMYFPVADPNGLITATVGRANKAKL